MSALWRLLCAALVLLALGACGKQDAAVPEAAPTGAFKVLAGSELRDIEPILLAAAREAGIALELSYAGTLDIVERINAGEHFDAILPPNGAYPVLALTTKPVAREKLFYSRVALGVKASKLRALGWDKRPPSWADIARVAGEGHLRYAMASPTSSNTGMSALFAVASAVAGKTEDLSVAEVDVNVLKAFLSGQKLTAGSSGWLAEAFIKESSGLDAMVNYEAVILRSNEQLAPAERLELIYPQDGVISADYPLMLLDERRREPFMKLVAVFKSAEVQQKLAAKAFLRPTLTDIPLAAGLPSKSVAELSFPNRLEVVDAVLAAYQGEWRRPATSIFVLDVSGSMAGSRLAAMREALKLLAGAHATNASTRYARFQQREQVVLISFSDRVAAPRMVSFDAANVEAARGSVEDYADSLKVGGGTSIYAALIKAEGVAAEVLRDDPERFVSIVLLTDGENNLGPDLAGFRGQFARGLPARVFPIVFGEASPVDMTALAQFTGGRVFDARSTALALVFKEIRGYQ